jgi:hypothetical protein
LVVAVKVKINANPYAIEPSTPDKRRRRLTQTRGKKKSRLLLNGLVPITKRCGENS